MIPEHQRDAWVRAYLEDVFNGHNLQSLDKYMTEDIVSHWLGDRRPGRTRARTGTMRWPQLNKAAGKRDLLFGLQRGCSWAFVSGIDLAAGKRNLPGMVSEMSCAE